MNILCCPWNFVCKQLEGDMAQGLAISHGVEEHDWVDHGGLAISHNVEEHTWVAHGCRKLPVEWIMISNS